MIWAAVSISLVAFAFSVLALRATVRANDRAEFERVNRVALRQAVHEAASQVDVLTRQLGDVRRGQKDWAENVGHRVRALENLRDLCRVPSES